FIGFEDDLLIANRTWFESFAQEYKKRINKPYRLCVRVECVTPEIVKSLVESGCKKVSLGLESGDERIRRELLNRKHSNDLIIEKCRMIKDAGIHLFTFNIVGFPFETEQEMKETYEINLKIAPDSGVCTFFFPYPNTHLYLLCKDNDLLLEDNEALAISNYNTKPGIRM